MSALYDPDYIEGHAPAVLTTQEIYTDLRVKLLAWKPAEHVQAEDVPTMSAAHKLATMLSIAWVMVILAVAWLA